MTLPQEPRTQGRGPERVVVVEEEVVSVTAARDRPYDRGAADARPDALRGATAAPGVPGVDPEYCEWDRGEWVGEGQEPPEVPAGPAPAETEPRWTKWQWVGEGQGEPGLRRGLPAAAMPDGANGFGGHRHNPGMAHWGGSRARRRVRAQAAVH